MDDATPKKPVRIERWLPYWAVFQADIRLTVRSWVYRIWVGASLLAVSGYLLYRYAPYHEAGIIHTASSYISDLLHWTVLVSAALVVLLTSGCISSERGTMADSVLSRGISRYQYFLGKWHARLVTILGTYLAIGGVALAASGLLLQEDFSWCGSFVALLTVAALLAAVISASVAASAVFSTTLMAVAVLWMAVYGGGFALNFLPGRFPAPDRTLHNLPNIVRGQFDLEALGQIAIYALVFSIASAVVGMGVFARRDV